MTKTRTTRFFLLPALVLAAALLPRGASGAGGDTCSAPTAISAVPYNDTGDTTGATDNVRLTGCAGLLSQEGPDHIYQFNVFAGNSLTFTLTPGSADYDISMYVRSGCLPTSGECVASRDVAKGGQAETLSVSGLSPGTYFLYIDSPLSGDKEGPGNGPYSLSVTGTLGVPNPASFYTVPPCRVLDTRESGPALSAGVPRTVPVWNQCAIPPGAKSISANATVTEPNAGGHLTVYPGGTSVPATSTINYRAGQTRANNAIVPLGTDGTISAFSGQPPGGTVHVILDVNGYFQ